MKRHIFNRYVGIDYSGAEAPDSSLKRLRVYEASRESLPAKIEPPPSPRKYWTRRGLAEWLIRESRKPDPHDAYVAAAWLRQADMDGSLRRFLRPSLLPGEYHVAKVEGWILGVM